MAKTKPKLKITDIQRQAGTENTYFIKWTWNMPKTDKYEVTWSFQTADGEWFKTSPASVTDKEHTYSPPDNAIKIKVHVKPIPEKIKDGNSQKNAWDPVKGKTTPEYILKSEYYIEAPETPEVSVDANGVLHASYDNLRLTLQRDYGQSVWISFQTLQDDTTVYGNAVEVEVLDPDSYGHAAMSVQLVRGHRYKVRGQVFVKKGKKNRRASNWSDWSENVSWGPSKVEGLQASAVSDNEVKLIWKKAELATGYDIEYTKDQKYFDTSSQVQSESIENGNASTWFISGLENTDAPTWYFRIRAKTDDATGEWSDIASTLLATKPEPPVTWSYTTSVVIGETVELSWTHNSADGSAQTAAEVQIAYNSSWHPYTISGDTQRYILTLDTETFGDNQLIKWRVRTKGAGPEFSEWSTERELTAHVQPTIGVSLYESYKWLWDPFNFTTDSIYTAYSHPYGAPISTATKYPLVIGCSASPDSQKALSFAVSITADQSYETEDEYGLPQNVYAGEEIFSRIIDAPKDNTICLVLMPNDIDLESNVSYTIHVTAAMDSGLTAEGEFTFDVILEDYDYYINAETTIDFDTLVCYIRPFCLDDDDNEVTNVTLNVYRRSYDGSFIPIATGLNAAMRETVTDPHPSLDVGRYRVVARSNTTGEIFYDDIMTDPIDHKSIVIQWAEDWTYFEYDALDDPEAPPWGGSMLQLPYNVDVSADYAPDVALVSYIGRENPVSYYGTQRGESGRWTCEIKKSDAETLYAIRRLAHWMGDVYVREPSGIGYWANIVVSYQETHNKLTVPVSFSIQKVEGGA